MHINRAELLDGKSVILTVTTGRSGTGYLTELLSALPSVACFHEPVPLFSDVMREAQRDPSVATAFWVERRLPAVRREASKVYIETSHIVCKGFLEPLIELGIVPDLILLSRPHREVAKSLLHLGTIPGRTEKGRRYYLCPEDPGVIPLPGWESLHDYQLCYWYCLEIERRRHHYRMLMSDLGANVVDVSLEELRTFRGVTALLKSLDLPRFNLVFWSRFLLRGGKKVNRKSDRKIKVDDGIDYDQLESEVIRRLGANCTPVTGRR